MLRCPNCLKENSKEAVFCEHCGKKLEYVPKEVYQLAPNTVLGGRYELGAVIGYGGFGVVYKAWDSTLQRVVAVKECYPTAYLSRAADGRGVTVFDEKNKNAFERMRAEFLDEARSIARFNTQPNVVHIYDFFEENGTAYFVMEYLDGFSLRQILKEQKKQGKTFDQNKAIDVIKGLLCALEATHAAGVIHRDIKPANIIILKNGAVKLFDFGSARFADMDRERTRTAIVTPGYAPPEQYQRKSKQGPYTDIYAVGALLYEMLTGIRPEESINRKVNDEVLPPRDINRAVSKNVSNAVMRAMALQPEIRFSNVGQFREALENSSGKVRDANTERRIRRIRRNIAIAAIVAAVALFGAFVVRDYFSRYREAVLAEAEITLWAPTMAGLDEEETSVVYENMLEEFLNINEQISVDIEIFDIEAYEDILADALYSADGGPDVFDATCVFGDETLSFADISGIFDYSEFNRENFYFLDDYESYFPHRSCLPLTFDVPVVYKNSMSEKSLLSEDYGSFVGGASDYIGSVDDLSAVQEDMAGSYLVYEGIPDGYEGSFYNIWCVRDSSSSEKRAAAERLLYWLLSDSAQEILTVENTNHMPLNKSIFEIYTEVNPDFEYIRDITAAIPMKGEDE